MSGFHEQFKASSHSGCGHVATTEPRITTNILCIAFFVDNFYVEITLRFL